MYFLSNQQEDHYFEANSRQFQTGRPVGFVALGARERFPDPFDLHSAVNGNCATDVKLSYRLYTLQ